MNRTEKTKSGEERRQAARPDISGLQALLSRATQGAQGPAAGGQVESARLRRHRHADRADGTWFYLGTPIGRMPLVRLFSTVLRKDEDGKTYLVTPVEKIEIEVEDAPFLAVEMHVDNPRAGPGADVSHQCRRRGRGRARASFALRAGRRHDGLKPYLHVRGNGWRRWSRGR
jgi:hypothetical protein